jgi:hypothetical protein
MKEKKEWSRSLGKAEGVKEEMMEGRNSDQLMIEKLKWKVQFY